ncbi:MAG: AI-2E family transporter [Caldilineaceae bacterium]|nr:AI-2E family transporter [Caldilineaceae bacterium]
MSFSEFLKRFFLVLLVFLLWIGLWAARATLLLGFAAVVIAVGISIPADWLQRRHLRRGWAIAIAAISVLFVAVLLILLVLPQLLTGLIDLFGNLPTAFSALGALYADLRERSTFLQAALQPLPALGPEAAITSEQAGQILDQLIGASMAIAPSLLGGVSSVVTVLVNLVFVFFIAIFFLVDPQSYAKAVLFLTPRQHHPRVIEIWNELYRTIRLWISALSLSIVITMALVWLILGVLLGMPNAVVVAVFAGLATFIPNIGALLPLIPITVFTLASNPAQLVVYAPVYLLIQLLESNVITPSIVKAELEIPPGGLMIFQLLATLALGALGLLLAVPMLAVLIVLVREIYSYDLLGLRHTAITLQADPHGKLAFNEVQVVEVTTPLVPVSPKSADLGAAQSLAVRGTQAVTSGKDLSKKGVIRRKRK